MSTSSHKLVVLCSVHAAHKPIFSIVLVFYSHQYMRTIAWLVVQGPRLPQDIPCFAFCNHTRSEVCEHCVYLKSIRTYRLFEIRRKSSIESAEWFNIMQMIDIYRGVSLWILHLNSRFISFTSGLLFDKSVNLKDVRT